MNYTTVVENGLEVFSKLNLVKVACDLAKLLDSPLLQLKPDDRGRVLDIMVELRQEVFDFFCGICVKAGVAVPELEPIFFDYCAPVPPTTDWEKKRAAEAEAKKAAMMQAVEGQGATGLALAIATTISLFPQILVDKFERIEGRGAIAALNRALVSQGLNPVRPDYSKINVALATERSDPQVERRLVIVDDKAEDIVRTWLGLAGWPNVIIDYVHYINLAFISDSRRITDDEKRADEARVAEETIAKHPHVVLMDEGLGPISGADVARLIFSRKTSDPDVIRIVGNTGGNGDALKRVGIYSNFEKGRRAVALYDAL